MGFRPRKRLAPFLFLPLGLLSSPTAWRALVSQSLALHACPSLPLVERGPCLLSARAPWSPSNTFSFRGPSFLGVGLMWVLDPQWKVE